MLGVNKIHQGDALEVLKTMDTESIDCCITSPPYFGLRDYGVDGQIGLEQTLEVYVRKLVDVFREVKRVLKKTGTFWLNMGDGYWGSGSPGGDFRDGKKGDQSLRPYNRTGENLKPKDLVGVPWRLAFALQDDGWWLRQDIIWCLSGGVKVYAKTQKTEGPMLVKDLVRLDPSTVQLWNGYKWTQVLGWNETPRPNRSLEIVLRSGERIGCTAEHKWPTQRGLLKASELRVGDVIDSCRLPQPATPETPDYIPDNIGYFIGMYIAEGSMSGNTIQIACHTKETVRYEILKSMAEGYGGTANWYSYKGKSASIHIHCPVMKSILNMYVSGRTAKNKRLNPTAWKRLDKFLDSVLLGYLAGDGHQDGERWRLGFTRNYEWEQDLRTICARLGYQLRLKPVSTTYQNGTLPAFRGEIRFKKSNHRNAEEGAEIVEIRNSRARKFYDIGVADEPHVFALASGVFTHNSKTNPMPESVRDRCTKAHEYIFLLTKNERYYFDGEAIKEEAVGSTRRDGFRGGSGTRYVNNRSFDSSANAVPGGGSVPNISKRNKRSVWTLSTRPYKGAHYATFPPNLIEPMILAGASEKGVCPECGKPWKRLVKKTTIWRSPTDQYGSYKTEPVGWLPTCKCGVEPVPAVILDPFMGAGTTALVARRHGRNYIGIELNPENIDLANKRLNKEFGSGDNEQ